MAGAKTLTTLTAVLQMNNTKFKKGLTGSQKALKSFQKQIKSIGGMIAGAFAVSAIVNFGRTALQALDTQRKAEASLLTALNGRIEAQQMLIKQAKELQKTTLYGDEETIKAAALIGTMVKEEETIRRLMPLVQDFATAKGMQLSAAADLVAKSIGSSTNALSRYGITITGAVGSAERLETAVHALNLAFGGQAIAAAEADVTLTQLRNQWGDYKEEAAEAALTAFGAQATHFENLDKILRAPDISGWKKMTTFFSANIKKTRELANSLEELNDESEETVEILKDGVWQYQKGIDAGIDWIKVNEEIFKQWIKENDILRSRIELQNDLTDALNETAHAYKKMLKESADEFQKSWVKTNKEISGLKNMQASEEGLWGHLGSGDQEFVWDDQEVMDLTAAWKSNNTEMAKTNDIATNLGQTIGMSLVNQFDDLGLAIGQFASGSADAFNDLGNAIMQNLGNILIMVGATMGAPGIPLIIAGAAMQLGGGIWRGLGMGNSGATAETSTGSHSVDFNISGRDLTATLGGYHGYRQRVT